MSIHRIINSFNAGELSPLMDSRIDVDKYAFSCRRMENFIPRIYGGAFFRPGMEFLGNAKFPDRKFRNMPFNYSASTRFNLEMGHEYIRFWSNDLRVEISGNPLEVATPYQEADLFDIQLTQLNDICYFAHPDYPVHKLTRRSDTDWIFEPVEWKYPALADQNVTAITAKVETEGGPDLLTFSEDVFIGTESLSDWVGTHFQIVHRREESHARLDNLSSSGNTSQLRVVGKWDVFTSGTWTGTLYLEEKNEVTAAWETKRSWTAKNDRNIVESGEEETETILRLRYSHESGSGGRATLEAADSKVYGLVKVTSLTNKKTAHVEVIHDLESNTPTINWSVEAWNKPRGYPRAVTFHEQRLVFGGNTSAPNTFWGSVTADFENFRRSTFDDGSFAFTMAATEGSSIESLVSQQALFIFTQGDEWTATTPDSTTITPTNVYVRRQSRFGSGYRAAFVADRTIIFVQRGLRKLREFVRNELEGSSDAADLSLLAEHVTLGGITQTAYQQQPDPIIWIVTGNGELVSMTYERKQNVVAWSRHPTHGKVESVSVTYGDAGAADEVWLAVKREIDGETVRHIERLDPDMWTKLDADDRHRLNFLDASIVITEEAPTTTFSGLDHLDGETITILADGNVIEDVPVTSGSITLDYPATTIVAGIPYIGLLQPSRTEVNLGDGTAQGRKFISKRLGLRLWKTLGMQYADSPDEAEIDWFEAKPRDLSTPMNEASPLFTGELLLQNEGHHRDSIELALRQTKPLPANVLALIAKFDIHGN